MVQRRTLLTALTSLGASAAFAAFSERTRAQQRSSNTARETIAVLGTDADEILVEQAKPFRNNPGPNESALVTQFNAAMAAAMPQ